MGSNVFNYAHWLVHHQLFLNFRKLKKVVLRDQKKLKMIYKAIILAFVITTIVAERDPATAPCTPGAKFKYFCNQCACSDDGKGASCTRMACYPGLYNEDGTMASIETPKVEKSSGNKHLPEMPNDVSLCVPGQLYRRGCSTCDCTACWVKRGDDCPSTENVGNKSLPDLPADGKCIEGQSYMLDCNVCVCGRNNHRACTLKACPIPPQ